MIALQRNVVVRTFDIEATVAVARDRPEFLAVARLAADLDRPIGGRDIVRELLGNLPENVGWRVIDRALALGLLERDGRSGLAWLSESGRTMLEDGAVLVPEEGAWRFYLVEDPLVAAPLLHAQRLDTAHAKSERDELYQQQRGNRPHPGSQPPKSLADMQEELLRSATSGARFEVIALGQRGEYGPQGTLRVGLEWTPGESPNLWLRGHLPSVTRAKGDRIDVALRHTVALQQLTHDALWFELGAKATGLQPDELKEWKERAGNLVMPTSMAELGDDARRLFMTTLPVPTVEFEGLGTFEPTHLENVSLVAESDRAAQEWAEWLLWEAINSYCLPGDVDAKRHAVARQFPLHRPQLPDADALLDRARSNPHEPAARFLLAPYDLGLWS